MRLSRAALQLLDLRRHDASHPRLGVVDHIALHPLGGLAPAAATQYGGSPAAAGLIPNTVWVPPPPGSTPLAVAATCANLIARQLSPPQAEEEEEEAVAVAEAGTERGGARGVGSSSSTTTSSSGSSSSSSGSSSSRGVATTVAGGQEEEVPALPVYFYGHAHPSRRGLADIRRKLGGFYCAGMEGWAGLAGCGSDVRGRTGCVATQAEVWNAWRVAVDGRNEEPAMLVGGRARWGLPGMVANCRQAGLPNCKLL